MSEEQIKHMVDRFLGWKLPEDFCPDAGISFKATYNDHIDPPPKHEPSGTNLFDAGQAEAMVRYMIEGIPDAFTAGRNAGLREAAKAAEGWYRNVGKGTPQDEILALIDTDGSTIKD